MRTRREVGLSSVLPLRWPWPVNRTTTLFSPAVMSSISRWKVPPVSVITLERKWKIASRPRCSPASAPRVPGKYQTASSAMIDCAVAKSTSAKAWNILRMSAALGCSATLVAEAGPGEMREGEAHLLLDRSALGELGAGDGIDGLGLGVAERH